MNPLLRLRPSVIPSVVKKQAVKQLLHLSADAFGRPAPSLRGVSYDDALTAFARFTRDAAEEALNSGEDLGAAKQVLYTRALALGARCRRWLRIRTFADAMQAARLLYGICRIDFHGSEDGTIVICRCLFSRYYSGEICGVIASADAGLLAGLSGGRRLSFSQRITEGGTTCIALLNGGEAS